MASSVLNPAAQFSKPTSKLPKLKIGQSASRILICSGIITECLSCRLSCFSFEVATERIPISLECGEWLATERSSCEWAESLFKSVQKKTQKFNKKEFRLFNTYNDGHLRVIHVLKKKRRV